MQQNTDQTKELPINTISAPQFYDFSYQPKYF